MSSPFLPLYHVLLFQVYFQQTTSYFWQFLATSGLFQCIPGYSRLMFRHFIPLHSCPYIFHLFPSIFVHLLSFSGYSRLFQAITVYYRLFPAIQGFSRIFQAISTCISLFSPFWFTLAVALRLWSCAWERLLPVGVPGHLGTHSE